VCQPSAWMPGAERQEADPLWMIHTRHNVLDRSSIPAGVAQHHTGQFCVTALA
jgi:hypothetical protein